MSSSTTVPLAELFLVFFKLGATAFGGPAAHIAMMQEEVVRRRGWLSEQELLDLLGVVNLLPGPTSTELALHIGLERGGPAGLIVVGVAFITPAMLITMGLGWAYVTYGELPQVGWLLYGVKPAMVAIVLHALRALAPLGAPTWWLRMIAVCVLVAALLGAHELAILGVAGLLSMLPALRPSSDKSAAFVPLLIALPSASALAITPQSLFLVFLKIGAFLFGSGYVLLAFLRAELVERLVWMSEAQLLDAITVGQITPGPVFTTATFIGYTLGGISGGVAATLGIFLPAFVLVAASGPLVRWMRRTPLAAAVLAGVNAASLALMAAVALQLARAALVDGVTLLLCVASLIGLVRLKLNPTWLLLGSGVVGVIAQLIMAR